MEGRPGLGKVQMGVGASLRRKHRFVCELILVDERSMEYEERRYLLGNLQVKGTILRKLLVSRRMTLKDEGRRLLLP